MNLFAGASLQNPTQYQTVKNVMISQTVKFNHGVEAKSPRMKVNTFVMTRRVSILLFIIGHSGHIQIAISIGKA